MKKIFLGLILFLGLFSFGKISQAEKIQNFDAKIKINQDASIDVSETIVWDFGNLEKHGIFRDIPIKYKARGGNYNLRISNISVLDEKGNPYNFKKSYPGNNIEIKIGDADKLVSGVKTYVINYKIKRAINYFSDHNELYWNATGDQWPVTIRKASATIILPEGAKAENLKSECFEGVLGSTERCQSYTDVIFSYSALRELKSGEGMTIVAGFPKGIVEKPSIGESFMETLKDNWILVLPVIVFIVMFRLWWLKGRDPKGRGTIIAQYEAPDNLTPLEVGTIIDERADNKDISAEIINLAVKGYLKISKVENKVFFKTDDYQLEKLKESNDLKEHFDKDLLSGIFKNRKKIKLSDLKNEFYKTLNKINEEIYDILTTKGYFVKNPNTVVWKYLATGFACVFLAFLLGSFFGGLVILSFIISGIVIGIFGWFMPARTLKGVRAKEYILGLKEYLSVAEADRIKFHNAPEKNPERFEKLLPYAMVLGVEKEWAKQFEGIYKNPPSWYSDPSGASFNSLLFVSSLHNFSASANSTLASTPSQASGGGSGFSGGSSGGGFGGGGGGSW